MIQILLPSKSSDEEGIFPTLSKWLYDHLFLLQIQADVIYSIALIYYTLLYTSVLCSLTWISIFLHLL
jgi:hypothetical protein